MFPSQWFCGLHQVCGFKNFPCRCKVVTDFSKTEDSAAYNPLYLPCVILIANWHIHSCGSHEDPLAWSKVKAASVERRSLASSSVRAVAHTVLRSPLLAIRAAKRGALCTRYRWALIFFFSCSWGWGYSNSPYPPQLLFFSCEHQCMLADKWQYLKYPTSKSLWPLFLPIIKTSARGKEDQCRYAPST